SDTPHCTLLRNDGGNNNHYLRITTKGSKSNLQGIGAKIRAVAGDLVQTREIRSSYGYMGSSDVRLTLGLGHHTTVDTLQVFWPSGELQTLLHLDANQSITIEEETGP
ncbi:MAG: hypothetical protein ACI8P2_001085, partial [Candidatus Latescibacterota bacterium]